MTESTNIELMTHSSDIWAAPKFQFWNTSLEFEPVSLNRKFAAAGFETGGYMDKL
jgi:hypothetical protein